MKIYHRYSGKLIFDGDNLQEANLQGANLREANLQEANLRGANLQEANLQGANLQEANLQGANLQEASLQWANLQEANLQGANLQGANLQGARLQRANLQEANLQEARLQGANLQGARLQRASLQEASLQGVKGLVKIIGVEAGNYYWKRFNSGLKNNNFQFYLGLNTLPKEEIFASDERVLCSYPGFHFASRSWCALYYENRTLEAKIRIPEGAKINEPWATDGKASADMIEILQVFDVSTGKDVSELFKRP